MSVKLMSLVIYDHTNKDSIVVRGDRSKYDSQIKSLGGRWYVKLKGGQGWTVPKAQEDGVRKLGGRRESEKSPSRKSRSPSSKRSKSSDKSSRNSSKSSGKSSKSSRSGSRSPSRRKERPLSGNFKSSTHNTSKGSGEASDIDSDNEDVISLSRKLRVLMNKIKRMEAAQKSN